MTEVEFQAGDELDGDLENEGFAGDAGGADENADATAVSISHRKREVPGIVGLCADGKCRGEATPCPVCALAAC